MPLMLESAILVSLTSNAATACECPWTSSNRPGCCSSKKGSGGEGTGDYCGNWFQKATCTDDAPVCCNSDINAHCCPAGSTCSPGCILGYKDVGLGCHCMPPPAPSPASAAYNVKHAKAIATLAVGAGCGPMEKFRTFKCPACHDMGFDISPGSMRFVTHKDVYTKNATFAYIARLQSIDDHAGDPGCVVGIRGSTNLANYVEDAEFWQQNPVSMDGCDGCKVHSGFYHAWADLQEDALAALEDVGCAADGNVTKVLVTGHSLGAAAAIVAMFELKGLGFEVAPSFVFELPRVGNKAFSAAFASRLKGDVPPVFVVTHAMDPVVHLPPTGLPGIEYQRVTAPELYFVPSFDSEQYIICDGPDDPECSSRYALPDTIASGDDHCRPIALAPMLNKDGVRDFCYQTDEFCSGGNFEALV